MHDTRLNNHESYLLEKDILFACIFAYTIILCINKMLIIYYSYDIHAYTHSYLIYIDVKGFYCDNFCNIMYCVCVL